MSQTRWLLPVGCALVPWVPVVCVDPTVPLVVTAGLGSLALVLACRLVSRSQRRAGGPASHVRHALAQSEARRQAVLEAIPDMLFIIDRDGIYHDHRAGDAADLLVPPERFLGQGIADVLGHEVADRFQAAVARIDAGDEVAVVEYHLDVDGHGSHFEARICACGRDRFLALVRNVTERVEAAAALAASERSYRARFEDNRAIQWVVDVASGCLLDVNRAACRFYGLEREELIGKPLWAIDQADEPQIRQHMQAVIDGGIWPTATMHRRGDGTMTEVVVQAGPAAEGDTKRLFAIVHELAGTSAVAEAIRHAGQRADEVRAERARFVRAVGGSVRGLLDDLQGSLALLAETARGEQQQDLVAGLRRLGDRIDVVADASLCYASLLAGTMHVQRQAFSPRRLFERLQMRLAGPAAGRPVVIVGGDQLPDLLLGDGQRFSQALEFLLYRSLQAMTRLPLRLHCRLCGDDDELELSVVIGRADLGSMALGGLLGFREMGETGDALSVSLPMAAAGRLLDALGARIIDGEEIEIRLPTRQLGAGVSGDMPVQGRRLLLVVEAGELAMRLRRQAEDLEMVVEHCGGALDALRSLDSTRGGFDLAIVQRHLPDIDGLLFLRLLRGEGAVGGLPVLLLVDAGGDDEAAVFDVTPLDYQADGQAFAAAVTGALEADGRGGPGLPGPRIALFAWSRVDGRLLAAECERLGAHVVLADPAAGLTALVGADLALIGPQVPAATVHSLCQDLQQDSDAATRLPVLAIAGEAEASEQLLAAGVDDVFLTPVDRDRLGRFLRRWLPGGSRTHRLERLRVTADGLATLQRDGLLHALIDEASYAQLMLPLSRSEPELLVELLGHVEQDGRDLIEAIDSASPAAIALAAQRLTSSAAGLCAAKLAEVARRIEMAIDGNDDDPALYYPMLEPLLEATLLELRERVER